MLRQGRLIRSMMLLVMAGLSMLSIHAQASYNAQNQLRAYGQASYRYDANGNTIERIDLINGQLRKTHYRYNAEQRLIQVSQALATAQSLNLSDAELQAKTAEQLHALAQDLTTQTLASYHYNPYGQRISKTVSEGTSTHTTYYLYSEQGLAAEYADNGQVMVEYHYRPDSPWMTNPITQKRNGVVYYYQNDELGTPERVLENTGRVMWEATHTAFGETSISTQAIENNLRLPGQYYDKETGTHYNYFRDYDPSIGRFISSDPIGLRGGLNTYVYANSNPIMYIDPLGLETAVVVGGPTPSNPFGHVAIATTGHGVESFGTGTPFGSSLTDYLISQSEYRDTSIYLIPTTPAQEQAIRDYLDPFHSVSLPKVPSADSQDTCASRTNGALAEAGLYDPSNPYATLGSMLGLYSPLPEASAMIGSFYSGNNVVSIPMGTTIIPSRLNGLNP